MATRNHAKDDIMLIGTRIDTALKVFLSIAAVVSAIGATWWLVFRLDAVESRQSEWNLASHEARIKALEEQGKKLMDGQDELRKSVGALKDSIAVVGERLAVGMAEIKTVVTSMASGVENAQRVALRAETLAIGQNVDKDFKDNAVQLQPQPKFGK